MNTCPPTDIWQRWLRKWLIPTPNEQETLIAHLESCTVCRQRFLGEYDQLQSANGDLRHMDEGLVKRLRESTVQPTAAQREPASPAEASRSASRDASPVPPAPSPRAPAGHSPANSSIPAAARSPIAPAPAGNATPAPKPAEFHPILVSHYCITRRIGEGAMGLVFEAEDTRNRKRVAIKFMKPELAEDERHRQRFICEARIAASLQHPNVVAIYEVGEFSGTPYMAMEYLAGESLRDRLKRGGPLAWREACRIGAAVAEGLAAAHQRNLIHRDIKPANIWLQHPGQRVKLLDFGLARFQDQEVELTKPGVVVGTPAYMSPEQIRGWELDERADLFSLGVVLYECLVGKRPFSGKDLYAVITQVLTEQPPSPAELRPEIPKPVSDYVMQLLEKDREKRPRTATDVAQTLRQLAEGKFSESAAAPSRRSEAGGSPSPSPRQVTPSLGGMPWVYWPAPDSETDEEVAIGDSGAISDPEPKRKKRRKKTVDYWKWVVLSAAIAVPLLVVYVIGSSLWHWYHQGHGTLLLEIDPGAHPLWDSAEVRIYDSRNLPIAILRGQNLQVYLEPGQYAARCTNASALELNKTEFTIQPRQVTLLVVRPKARNNPAIASSPQSPPQAEPSPEPESEPQRLGRKLLEQIVQAQPNERIPLPAGRYVLPGKLVLQQPITLIGAGPERTIISGGSGEALLECRALGLVTLSGLTLEYTGQTSANVIVVYNGSLSMDNCTCRGGKAWTQPAQPLGTEPATSPATGPAGVNLRQFPYGNGLVILAPSSATIVKCRFVQNQGHGVLVSVPYAANNPLVSVQGCTLENNGGAGICFQGGARGRALSNQCVSNNYGILVTDGAEAYLEGNHCRNNSQYGIAFCRASKGNLVSNWCGANAAGDFLIEQSLGARPVIGLGNVGTTVFR